MPPEELAGAEPGLEAMVRELWAREQIRQVLTRYTRGVDRMDRALFLSAYHPDAIDDHGFFVGDPQAFWSWVNSYHTKAQAAHQHIVTNHVCELAGDVAHCETYWMFVAMDHAGQNVPFAGGRYLDRMERRAGEWRIAARKCVADWFIASGDAEADGRRRALAGAGTVARDRSDASYERPLTIAAGRIAARASS